jgi:hypothetical protein
VDVYGHDCGWYYEQKKKSNGVCASKEVKEKCPVACSELKPCFESHYYPTHFNLYRRVMKFEAQILNSTHDSALLLYTCTRQLTFENIC